MKELSHSLAGIKVVELSSSAPAPAPFAGLVLADQGADVIRVDRTSSATPPEVFLKNVLYRGKRSISVNMKVCSPGTNLEPQTSNEMRVCMVALDSSRPRNGQETNRFCRRRYRPIPAGRDGETWTWTGGVPWTQRVESEARIC